ncbi:tripartite motif-containing protein 45 [Elysia marginata]|uniref:Tripartite motif-containing protein 45 n=1 Tax=Elysia marginata TaxID=1093978 RepID=A0AAV4FBG3_9GAST|nr:tripartite motif-containing protein 45 [Elysia marginata]
MLHFDRPRKNTRLPFSYASPPHPITFPREESDSALDSTKHSGSGTRCGPGVGGTDSGLGLDLVSSSLSGLSAASSSNSELAKHVYEQNRMKGPGATLPKSESDEFSDLTSDLDFDELASERSRPDGGSSTDENVREGMAPHERGNRRNKHRPRYLHLTRSHSHTSSDEEDDQDPDGALAKQGGGGGGKIGSADNSTNSKKSKPMVLPSNAISLAPQQNQSVKCLSSSSSSSSSTSSSSASYTLPQGGPTSGPQDEHRTKSNISPGQVGEISGDAAVNSPTPRSPSWREGLESPPFSPRRRDSYPGKRRGSLSPKEKKSGGSHFTYSDISPPSRQLSLDELYGNHTSGSTLDNGVAGSQAPQRPSPMSPQEIKDAAVMTTSGHALVFDMPPAVRNGKQQVPQQPLQQSQAQNMLRQGGSGDLVHPDDEMSSSGEPVVTCGVPHSAPVMDLATFAATITSSTNTLTSLTAGSVSPNTQNNASPSTLSGSPEDSEDSSCSSPVSPGYYDNATPPSDEPEEVCELADPSSKSIDMQGSKRQKARPPSTDWSPVIDLSPILDVSPSVEEAEQEDMLAKRMEELERQRSREAEEEGEEEESEELEEKISLHQVETGFPSRFRGKAGPPVAPLTLTNTELPEIPRIPPPPSAKKLKQQLNEELEEAGNDGSEAKSFRNSHDKDDDDEEDEGEMDMSSSFIYGSSLRRCGNFEDISRLSCDSSSILTSPMDYSTTDDGIYSSDVSQDFPFPSCTSQAESFSTVSSMSTSTVSSIGCSTSNSSSNSSSISSDRDIEMLDITDQIQRITQDMENIVKKGDVVDARPVPPPKPKRRLPDAEVGQSPPPSTCERKDSVSVKIEERKAIPITKEQSVKASVSKTGAWKGPDCKVIDCVGKKQNEIHSVETRGASKTTTRCGSQPTATTSSATATAKAAAATTTATIATESKSAAAAATRTSVSREAVEYQG